jgi:hypothetical protein
VSHHPAAGTCPKGLELTKVNRRRIADGSVYLIECAVCSDGDSPASDFLDDLAAGLWQPDPDTESLPSDAQLKDRDIFLEFCKRLADTGLPAYVTAVNDLNDGIWEFKRGAKRLSFYDTPGNGTYEPKYRIRDFRESSHPHEDYWWFPDFDDFIRLGHAFPKLGNAAGDLNINETQRVRREDVEHDR